MVATSEWIKFFQDAGIPRGPGAQYAVTFSENRINMDMLMDLNKEYLRDMGITVLGDIISILKHAKTVQDKITTDRALSSQPEKRVASVITKPTKTSTAKSPLPQPVPSLPSPAAPSAGRPAVAKNVVATTKVHQESPRATKTLQDPSRATKVSTKTISERLGPPPTRSFAELGIGMQGEDVEEVRLIKTVRDGDSSPKRGVFSRLGSHEGAEKQDSGSPSNPRIVLNSTSSATSAFDRLGGTTSAEKISVTSPTTGILRHRLKEVPTRTLQGPKVVSLKRSIDNEGAEKRVSFKTSYADGLPEEPKQKKKKYIMIKTNPDGTKVKKVISPDDPILSQVKVTKKIVRRSSSSTSTPDVQGRKFENFTVSPHVEPQGRKFENFTISRNIRSSTDHHRSSSSAMASRSSPDDSSRMRMDQKPTEPIRKRITAPGERSVGASVRKRISPPHRTERGHKRISPPVSPVPRKRISAPTWSEERPSTWETERPRHNSAWDEKRHRINASWDEKRPRTNVSWDEKRPRDDRSSSHRESFDRRRLGFRKSSF